MTQPGGYQPPHFDPQSTIHPSAAYFNGPINDGTVGLDGTGGVKSGGTVGM